MASVEDVRQGIEAAKAQADEALQQLLAARESLERAAETIAACLQGSSQQDAAEIHQRYQNTATEVEELAGQIQQCMDEGEKYASRL